MMVIEANPDQFWSIPVLILCFLSSIRFVVQYIVCSFKLFLLVRALRAQGLVHSLIKALFPLVLA